MLPDTELAELSELEVFDKDKLKALIERVIVYGADAIEIVWKLVRAYLDGGNTYSKSR